MAQAREAWRADPGGVGGISPERLVFLDECGVLTNMTRLSGRSPRGVRACASAPFGHWTRVIMLGALGAEGIVGAMSVEAATDAAVFYAYLDEVLLPELRRTKPAAVLILDNLPAHKAPRVRALLDASGFGYRYLPAYSPDLNPIEPAPRSAPPIAASQTDREGDGQGESHAAPRRRPNRGHAAGSARPRPRRHHPAGRRRVLPPLRLQSSQVTGKRSSRQHGAQALWCWRMAG